VLLVQHGDSGSSTEHAGTTRSGRKEFATIPDFIRAGDIGDLQDIVRTLKAKGADLKATEQPIDTSTAAGKAFLDMLGVFAEFETNLRRERQLEGIAKAKAEGVYKGGTRRLDRETVRAMFVAGHPERRPIRLRPPRLPRIGPPFLRVSPHFQQACGLICLRI
jgi:DNA invertase Pin-like site-specific DNA recombinase